MKQSDDTNHPGIVIILMVRNTCTDPA